MQSIRHLFFLHIFCKAFYAEHSNSCIYTPIENWTHVYMNLFTQNRPYYHLLKYLLFLLKHHVYKFSVLITSLLFHDTLEFTFPLIIIMGCHETVSWLSVQKIYIQGVSGGIIIPPIIRMQFASLFERRDAIECSLQVSIYYCVPFQFT